MSVPIYLDTSMLSDEQASRFLLLVAQANRGAEAVMPELVQVGGNGWTVNGRGPGPERSICRAWPGSGGRSR